MGKSVEKNLEARRIGDEVASIASSRIDVVVHDSIDSTNSWALQQCKAGKLPPFACFAEAQTQGRGRRGKQWLMPPRSNIAMSLAWAFEDSAGSENNPVHNPFHLLPLNIAMAIVDTLEQAGVEQVQVKWPNDVYVRGRKIAGILIETLNRGGRRLAVIGIGLNYDVSQLAESSLPPYTDIYTELAARVGLDEIISRNKLAAALLSHAIQACNHLEQQAYSQLERFSYGYDFCKDKAVNIVTDNGNTLSGIARGVNHMAELVVEIDGEQAVFNSAEVSIRSG